MINFHPWIGTNPIERVELLKKNAFQWNLAATISSIAMSALSFFVVWGSFFITLPLTVTLGSMCVITPLLSYASSYFRERAVPMEIEIEKEDPVAKEYKNILHWDESQILSFFEEIEMQPPNDIELSKLLPLIARYRAKCNQAIEFAKKGRELQAHVKDREICLWQRLEAWRYLEEIELPAKLEAAYILEIFHNPKIAGQLTDHFKLIQKSFAERVSSQTWDNEDLYLEFLEVQREPITFTQLKKISDPKMIHKLIYS